MFKFRFCKRKLSGPGSAEAFFEPHSSAMGREKGKRRFREWQFAAQSMNFKHALSSLPPLSQLKPAKAPLKSRFSGKIFTRGALPVTVAIQGYIGVKLVYAIKDRHLRYEPAELKGSNRINQFRHY